jgi:hypothetical protein
MNPKDWYTIREGLQHVGVLQGTTTNAAMGMVPATTVSEPISKTYAASALLSTNG